MTIRLTNFGGTDWIDGQVLNGSDLDQTIKQAINVIGGSPNANITYSSNTIVSTRIITAGNILVSGGATLTISGTRTCVMIATGSIIINGSILGTAYGGLGGITSAQFGGSGLCSAGGKGGGPSNTSGPAYYVNYADTATAFGGSFSTTFFNEMTYNANTPNFWDAYKINYANFTGGGGGAGTHNPGTSVQGSGGNGGVGLILVAPNIFLSGAILNNGGNGQPSTAGTGGDSGGGGGAGGPVFIFAKDTFAVASGLISSVGGSGAVGNNGAPAGGGGAGGLISIQYGVLAGGGLVVNYSGAQSGLDPGQNGNYISYTWRGAA